MAIVLNAPEWGKPKNAATDSPIFLIDLMSHEGQLLNAAFDLREKNLAVGGGKLAPLESDGFVRVRVKVTRDELGGQLRLTINDLKSCHWMDSDITGF